MKGSLPMKTPLHAPITAISSLLLVAATSMATSFSGKSGGAGLGYLNSVINERGPLQYFSMFFFFALMGSSILARTKNHYSPSYRSQYKTYILVLIIIGITGTFLGIGSAVAGFSSFLAGTEDIGIIKNAISNVTAGLGTAMDTCLLALFFALIALCRYARLIPRFDNWSKEPATGKKG
jgi:hypothetical protein